jgi:electron-transferring-flavoprotein dehydrogenase
MTDIAEDNAPERESMEFDVVIVGAGPAGLSAAIRLKQRAAAAGTEVSVAVLEKGSEVGAHILSGAVIDPCGLDALMPDWRERGSGLTTQVSKDQLLVLTEQGSISVPGFIMPPLMNNHGNYIGSLGDLCRFLAGQAEALGVEIYPGFAAAGLVIEDGAVKGVVTNDLGVNKAGERTESYQPGMALLGKYTLIAEGVRGNLGKELIARYGLDADAEPQKYGIGLKELWQVAPDQHRPGLVQHSFGWPLKSDTGGGSFLYHFGSAEERFVSVGFVVHLNYENPFLDPYQEFQRFKHHPAIAPVFSGGRRISYGARAISEGGYQSAPKLVFPGGVLIGDSAGFVNLPRIKGSHNAVRTGMMAADAAFDALGAGRSGDRLDAYQEAYRTSAVAKDLRLVRNVKPLWSRFGLWGGVLLGGFDMWVNTLLGGFSFFGTLGHGKTDAASTGRAEDHTKIEYPKPDGVLSFDRLSSVFISNTNHEEDQPSHLKLRDPAYPLQRELPVYGAPSTRYCPAGVYEYVPVADGGLRFQINAQNCVHCKTCDIKDPEQNIYWTPPEGGGGPNYPNL